MRHGAKAGVAKVAVLVCVAVGALTTPAVASATTLPFLTKFPENPLRGDGANQLRVSRALESDPDTGHVYVVESGNSRVSEFTPWGEFVKSFGWDVAPAGVNEQQEIRVRATSGEFKLSFGASTTADLPFEASAGQVQAALNALPSIGAGGGAVEVDAQLGNQLPGLTPTIYVVSFTAGPLEEANVEALTASNGTTPLGGGKPTDLEVRTRADGTPGGSGLEACTSESGCKTAAAGTGGGQLRNPNGVAVDSNGNLFVLERVNARVQKFSSSGEFLLMFGGEVDKTTGANICTKADLDGGDVCGAGVEGTAPGWFIPPHSEAGVPQFTGSYIALGADDTVYVGDDSRIQEFEPNGTYKGAISFASLHSENVQFPSKGNPNALAYSPQSGDLYFSIWGSSALSEGPLIYEVSPATGKPVATFVIKGPANTSIKPEALATDDKGDLFVDVEVGSEPRVVEFGPGRELLIGVEEHFASLGSEPFLERTSLLALATNGIGGLYVAESNANRSLDSISVYGPGPVVYGAPPVRPPAITEQYATAANTTEATVRARINPRFWADTRYYVEYGPSPCFEGGCQAQPAPPGSLLTDQFIGSPMLSGGVFLSGLEPNTTYHYRFVAQSSGGGPAIGLTGQSGAAAEATFTTLPLPQEQPSCSANEAFRPGPAAFLPDCRAYEMVSPIEKNGADVSVLANVIGDRAGLDQAAPDGESLTYSAYRAFGDAESSPYASQYMATREAGAGWSSHSISPPREGRSLNTFAGLDSLYKGFSADLCQGWLLQDSDIPLGEGWLQGWANLYRRDLCAGGYVHLAPLVAPRLEKLEEFRPEVQGFSADGSRTIFVARGQLVPARVGSRLKCVTSTSATKISRRWLRNGVPISAATGATYTIAVADEGKAIQCQVTATNANAGSTAVANPPVMVEPVPGVDVPVAPDSIAAPSTSAPLTVGGPGGQTLSCDPNEAGWDGEPSFAYQWYRNGAAIAGATASTYLVGSGDVATAAVFQCAVSATNAGGTATEVSGNLPTAPAPSEPAAPTVDAEMPAEERQLFEASNEGPGTEKLALVCILPNGKPFLGGCTAGTMTLSGAHYDRSASVRHAISEDGQAIYWTANETDVGKLYVRIGGSETTQVSSGNAHFWAAAADGSKAIYSEAGSLLAFDLASKTSSLLAGGVKGVMGVSDDASRIYLVSTEAKAAGATAGQPNLYLYEAGEPGSFTFIAALAESDLGGETSSVTVAPIFHTAQVSGDGGAVAFMSVARPGLTGYDNTDAVSGQADAEVYVYRAGAEALACVSCMPSGVRPAGRDLTVGGWTAARIPAAENQLTFPRVLTENGNRLFFESFDPLSLRDTNGRRDVYEWEAAGEGNCGEGAPGFNAAVDGCVNPISSGESPEDSEIVDTSADGRDVFFKTSQSLTVQDPGLVDIYDAREGGGLPVPAQPPAGCEGEACQSAPEAPNDPTPASESFSGAGNVAEAPTPSRCAKGKVRRKGRCVPRRHRRHAKHNRRATR